MTHSTRERLLIPTLLISLLFTSALISSAVACYWDKDTLASEKRKFPGVLELLTGRFKRHSPEFYQWRITDRERRLEETPDQLPLMDDLAVALDKTGSHKEAAEVMLRALKLNPNRYETHANLGTIYIHSSQFDKGLKHIDRALEINPKAHFGREIIQRELVTYVLKIRANKQESSDQAEPVNSAGQQIDPQAQPTTKDPSGSIHAETKARFKLPLYRNQDGYNIDCSRALQRVTDDFDQLKRHKTLGAKGDELSCPGLGKAFGFAAHLRDKKISFKDGLKGIMGMMKFSNHKHPILLEALGDLLLAHRSFGSMGRKDAKQLASRAYLSASRHTRGEAAQSYQAKALMALVGTRQKLSFMQVQTQFKREVARGDQFFTRHTKRERRNIQKGEVP